MKVSLVQGFVFSGIVVLAVACQPIPQARVSHMDDKKPVKPSVAEFVKCKTPRPEACTHQYQPVCANKDTGIRCFKAPCPAAKKVTYGNACSACADKKVYSYVAGVCKK